MSPTIEDEAQFQATLLQDEEKLGTSPGNGDGLPSNSSGTQLHMHITKVNLPVASREDVPYRCWSMGLSSSSDVWLLMTWQ